MTSAAEWYEHEVSRRAGRSALVGAATAGGLAASAAALSDISTPVALATGLVAAVATTILRGAVSFLGHPTAWPHHRRYLAHRPELVGVGWAGDDQSDRVAETIGDLAALGFTPVDTLVDRRADDAVVLHVLSAREGVVTAMVAVPSGSATLMTRLVDGRTLVSAGPGIPVSDELVVNPVRSSRAVDVVAAHARTLKLMFETRLQALDPVDLTVETVAAERRAWAALGPVSTAVASVGMRRSRVRLTADVPDEAVLVQSALAVTSSVPGTVDVPVARPVQRPAVATAVPLGGGTVEARYSGVGR